MSSLQPCGRSMRLFTERVWCSRSCLEFIALTTYFMPQSRDNAQCCSRWSSILSRLHSRHSRTWWETCTGQPSLPFLFFFLFSFAYKARIFLSFPATCMRISTKESSQRTTRSSALLMDWGQRMGIMESRGL